MVILAPPMGYNPNLVFRLCLNLDTTHLAKLHFGSWIEWVLSPLLSHPIAPFGVFKMSANI